MAGQAPPAVRGLRGSRGRTQRCRLGERGPVSEGTRRPSTKPSRGPDPECGSWLPCPKRQLSAPCGGAGCSCGARMGCRPGSLAERPEGPAEACSDPRQEARCPPPAKGL